MNKQKLLYEIDRCQYLYDSNILSDVMNDRSIFSESAFIEILIRLKDVLQQLNTANMRINWRNDVKTGNGIEDITDLVSNLRNAACHITSPENT